jgi:hypothetical protein
MAIKRFFAATDRQCWIRQFLLTYLTNAKLLAEALE